MRGANALSASRRGDRAQGGKYRLAPDLHLPADASSFAAVHTSTEHEGVATRVTGPALAYGCDERGAPASCGSSVGTAPEGSETASAVSLSSAGGPEPWARASTCASPRARHFGRVGAGCRAAPFLGRPAPSVSERRTPSERPGIRTICLPLIAACVPIWQGSRHDRVRCVGARNVARRPRRGVSRAVAVNARLTRAF